MQIGEICSFFDQLLELAGGAVAGGGCEISAALVTPGAVEGMLGNRHYLDVGVAHIRGVL